MSSKGLTLGKGVAHLWQCYLIIPSGRSGPAGGSFSWSSGVLARVRQGLKIWRGLPGARSRFAGGCAGDMPLSTARRSNMPGAPRDGLRPCRGGKVSPRGFSWGVIPWSRLSYALQNVSALGQKDCRQRVLVPLPASQSKPGLDPAAATPSTRSGQG